MRDVYVIGIDTLKFDKYLDKSIKDLAQATTKQCLKDAGLEKESIEALWFSNSGWGFGTGQDCIRGQVALRDMGIENIPITNVENACASGSTAFHHAWLGVASGLYETTMAVGAEKLYNENKMSVFAGFLGGIDIENCLENVKSMSGFSLSEEDRHAITQFRQQYPEAKTNGSKHKKSFSSDLKNKIKKARDSAVVGINLGEKLGYDTVMQLQKVSGGDHSPFMDIYGYAARQHMRES